MWLEMHGDDRNCLAGYGARKEHPGQPGHLSGVAVLRAQGLTVGLISAG